MRIRLDEKWMGMAVGLAKRAGNSTRPNPRVGAVVVKNNKIVGILNKIAFSCLFIRSGIL